MIEVHKRWNKAVTGRFSLPCLGWILTSCNVSRTAMLGCREAHTIKNISNQFLKKCFLFGQKSASKLRHSFTKSEQAISHHTLWTSLMTSDELGHFVPHQWLFLRHWQWGLQLANTVFITLLLAKTWNNLSKTLLSIATGFF